MTELRQLRIVALLEGASFVLLLFVAMPLKYLAHQPLAVRIAGSLHGCLFLALSALVLQGLRKRGKPTAWGVRIGVAAVVPFGTFFLDRELRAEDEAERLRNNAEA